LAGLILVILYSLYYFRALSGVSVIFLLGSALLTYGAIVLLGRWICYSLDLSGIAGLVIGVGATADSFVVYYERIKDELLEGRTFRSATQKAWERSRSTIVTGNAVTLIGSVIVYFLAIGEVKGFAFTLGLTTVFDLVVSFLVMAPLMQIIGRRPAAAKPSMNGLGGIYALIEERRERGYYGDSRSAATTPQERSTENSASVGADSSESSSPSAAAEDEEK